MVRLDVTPAHWSTARGLVAAAVVAVGLMGLTPAALAQGGYQTLDPFYGGETARRGFYGDLAVSAEAAYRDADLLGLSEPGQRANSLALAGRLDYALMPQVDLSLVADLSGGIGRGPLGLSWVVLKPYWHNEMTDYAVRVAVDPANEGGLGFRQTDVAFLSTTALSPDVTSDLSIGVRRVRTGYTDTDSLSGDGAFPTGGDTAGAFAAALGDDAARVRVVGQELRVAWGYNVLFDPAGSRLIVGLAAEAGDYALVRSGEEEAGDASAPERIRSGTGWLRLGLEFSRPNYQVAPFASVPLATWADVRGEPVRHGPRPEKVRVGLRVTLR